MGRDRVPRWAGLGAPASPALGSAGMGHKTIPRRTALWRSLPEKE
jgi:hypothetical protein